MRKFSARRLLAGIVATVVCSVATIVGSVAPAHAAASGYLLIKGTGSVYTSNDIVNLGVTPGSAKNWGLKVVNTGDSPQQFKLTIDSGVSPHMAGELFLGSTRLGSPYWTAPIPPGKSLTFTIKVTVLQGAPVDEYVATVILHDPETNTFLDNVTADANATYQTGNTRNDLFVKTGSQPYVGGSTPQFITATALKPGNTASFTLRLKNNGGSPAVITLKHLGGVTCPSSFQMVVKDGTANVTAAVIAGTYSSGVLTPGARKDLKLTVKLLSATVCTAAYFGFTATGPDGPKSSYAHVVTAA